MGFHRLDAAYPWDAIVPLRERAGEHPGGVVDLSIGTPVDPSPSVVRRALEAASDAPGYPTVHGPTALRQAVVDWFARRRGVMGLDVEAVLPTVGSKELVAALPSLLGLGPGDAVVVPSIAYPTYEVGARLAGAEVIASDDPRQWVGRAGVRLVWVNSPSNPTGRVASVAELAAVVAAARSVGAVVASDECYAELAWADPWLRDGVPCVLDHRVTGGDPSGVLAVYSLSKQSNLAGYRAAFVAGDPALLDEILQVRRHMGAIVPHPVQAAMQAALSDDEHVAVQRARYAERRAVLVPALEGAGLEISHSEAGLYLWVEAGPSWRHPGADCWSIMSVLAEAGIVAGPGAFYGSAGMRQVRIALTATDERVTEAARRLAHL